MSDKRERLTKTQEALLSDIKGSDTGGLWIVPTKQYGRTAEALARKGYARITDSGMGQHFYEAMPESES